MKDKFSFKYLYLSIYGYILFTIIFLTLFIVAVPASVLLFILRLDKHRNTFVTLTKFSVYTFFSLFVGHKLIINKEKLKKPEKGKKVIYLLNHASIYDVILMYVLPGNLKFLMKESWMKKPLIGWMQKFAGNVVVKEDSSVANANDTLTEISNLLKHGNQVLIYPEGTRSRSGKLQRFRNGSFKFASETEASIVPVILDTWNCIRPGSFYIRDNKPAIKILDEIPYESFSHLSYQDLSKITKEIMLRGLIELRDERRQTEKKYYRKADKFIKIDNEMKDSLVLLQAQLREKGVSLKV